MAKCKNCVYYKRINEQKGDCFGHEVPANADTDKCPTKSFKQKNKSIK
ncbi:MAG: hypothetical protein ACOYT4_01880 [Nanoarchaeota archaeon]